MVGSGGSETLLRYHAGWCLPLMVKRYVRKNGERLAIINTSPLLTWTASRDQRHVCLLFCSRRSLRSAWW